jgi:hypothetical protein
MVGPVHRLLVGVCACAVMLNCLTVFVVIPELSKEIKPFYSQGGFQDGYDLIAANLAEGKGYRLYPDTAETLMREPGYPILLAGLRLTFGPSFTVVKVANVCLTLVAACLLCLLARRISGQGVLSFVPALLFLLHPGTVLAESRGGVEILFTTLVTLSAITVYRAIETTRYWDYALAGGVLGVAVLIRSTPIMLPIVFLLYLLATERARSATRVVFRNIACMTGTMVLVLTPWIVRNYRITGQFVPTASVLGVSAQAGQYICSHITPERRLVDLDREASRERVRLAEEAGFRVERGYYQAFYASEDELTFSRYLLKRVVVEYEKRPWLCVKCLAYNAAAFWCAGKTWGSTAINAVIQIPYLFLAATDVARRIREKRFRAIGPLVLITAYTMGVSVPILAQARYSVPVIPFVSALAAAGLVGICGQSLQRLGRTPMTATLTVSE